MSKYIPADKLIAEIERQQRRLMLLSHTEQVDMRRDCAIQNGVYSYILSIITALRQEQPEVELKEIIEQTYHDGSVADTSDMDHVDYKNIASHFFELGRNARKEE